MHEPKENTITEENEFEHLIKLLDDEDEDIYSRIKSRFLSHGENTSKYLHDFLNDENHLIKKRANEIISILNFENIENKFRDLSLKNENEILEEASFLLASYEYPGIDMDDYKNELDAMANDIESLLLKIKNNVKLETLDILNTVNNYLFFDKGFKGNTENYYDADNSYLNKVLERKLGIPISLSILYILISKRLKLPVHGIGLPGHFILKYSDKDEEFFIDPFNGGVIISINEAKEIIKKTGMPNDDLKNIPLFKYTSEKEIILRSMRNLVEIFNKEENSFKAAQMEKLMESLT